MEGVSLELIELVGWQAKVRSDWRMLFPLFNFIRTLSKIANIDRDFHLVPFCSFFSSTLNSKTIVL